jgi:hypothetical protein
MQTARGKKSLRKTEEIMRRNKEKMGRGEGLHQPSEGKNDPETGDAAARKKLVGAPLGENS